MHNIQIYETVIILVLKLIVIEYKIVRHSTSTC